MRYVLKSLVWLLAGSLSLAQCPAPPSWFPHEQTPRPNDNADFNSNCKFHQWSWQMFLWLTQEAGPNGELRFETLPTPAEMFDQSEGGLPKEFAAFKAPSILKLSPGVNKSMGTSSLGDIHQAGSKGVLVDQNGRVVYFSQHINDVFYNFVRSNKYYIPENYKNAPAEKNYPIGTLELKVAWKVLDNGETGDGLYVRKAEINLLEEKDGEVVIGSATKQVDVALVGMHVVGVVKDHPEFIWATFEAKNNAPDLPKGMDPAGDEVVSEKDWLFYAKGTPAKDCNVNNASKVILVDSAKQHLAPITEAYVRHPQGGGSSSNMANIVSLNQNVQNALAADSIWKNYYLGGATWLLPNSLKPNQPLDGSQNLVAGSTKLSNATMETFTQNQSFVNNCFKCHNTKMVFPPSGMSGVGSLPPKNMNISHAMTDAYFLNAQKKRLAEAMGNREKTIEQFKARILKKQ